MGKYFGKSYYSSFFSLLEIGDGYIVAGESSSEDMGFENVSAILVNYDKNFNQKEIYNLGSEKSYVRFFKILSSKDGYIVNGNTNAKDLGFEFLGEVDSFIIKYTDPDIISSELNKLLEELNSLIKEDDKENKNFYDEVKESIDKYNTLELKAKRDETKKRIDALKDKVDNPETGIIGYTLLLIMIILLSIYVLKYKKKYL